MELAVKGMFLAVVVAALMTGMPGMARAEATQPTVVRPEIAQFRADRPVSGECDLISVHVGSDESLFGNSGADGVR